MATVAEFSLVVRGKYNSSQVIEDEEYAQKIAEEFARTLDCIYESIGSIDAMAKPYFIVEVEQI